MDEMGSLQSGHISSGSSSEALGSLSSAGFRTMLAYKSPMEVSVDLAGVIVVVVPASGSWAGTNSTLCRFSPAPKARL